MEFPSSILESEPFYFKTKDEILDPFPEEVKTVFKVLADKEKTKHDSEQQFNLNDFIQQNSKYSLQLDENTESNIEKPLENGDALVDNNNLQLGVGFINTQSFHNDMNSGKLVEDISSAQFLRDSAKHNENISELVEDSLSQDNEITNSSYDAGTSLVSTDITTIGDVDFKQGIDAVEVSPQSSEERSNLEVLEDESAIDKMFNETFHLSQNEGGEESLNSDIYSGMNNHSDVRNDENKSVETDNDDTNLPVEPKSEDTRYSTEKYEDQISSPIISNKPTIGEVTSNYEPNQRLLLDSDQDNFEDTEKEFQEEVMHPMSPDEFILSQTSAATNTDIPSHENEYRDENAEDVIATSFCANEPVVDKSICDNDARDL